MSDHDILVQLASCATATSAQATGVQSSCFTSQLILMSLDLFTWKVKSRGVRCVGGRYPVTLALRLAKRRVVASGVNHQAIVHQVWVHRAATQIQPRT